MKKYLIVFFVTILFVPAFGQEIKNPSLAIDNKEIPWYEFNVVASESQEIQLDDVKEISWQVTIDNNLLYTNENGNAVLRLHDNTVDEKFIEIGMGAPPHDKFWIAVQLPEDEGYVVVHSKLERGWLSSAKTIASYTERAGLTVNNGVRIVVSNLDIGDFAIKSYSVFGKEGTTEPPAVYSGIYNLEFLSGDPSKNIFALFPFYIAAAIGVLVGVLFLTKRR